MYNQRCKYSAKISSIKKMKNLNYINNSKCSLLHNEAKVIPIHISDISLLNIQLNEGKEGISQRTTSHKL